ncbi:MAG TPA: DUF1579 family protein [Actinomycetota bacterium]|nr:DUF1579 family protein [Actinomycetota bacterium]
MDEQLQRSLSPGGPHHLLGLMAGRWSGRARTWLEPGQLADDSPVAGEITPLLDGMFAMHRYEGSFQGTKLAGCAIHGFDLGPRRHTMSWVDSFHNGTATMLSLGREGEESPVSVLGSYGAGDQTWGWRTQLDLAGPDALVITHFNITPAGEEALGVEIRYERTA